MDFVGGGVTDALVLSASWHESEGGVSGVIYNGSGFEDAAVVVRDIDSG